MRHQKSARAVSLFCVTAPEDKVFLDSWKRHLLPLIQADQITVWSNQHLMAGTNRLQQVNDYLEDAQVMVFLLSADFFADDECMTLMGRALVGQARVIPLLLRPVDWKASKLADLACLPTNGQFVTTWENQDEAFQISVNDLRQLLGLPAIQAQTRKPAHGTALENQNRERMLRRLRRTYRDLMSQSLQGAAWLELSLSDRSDAVQNAANLLLHVENRTERSLPPGTSIIKVYDEAEHELLILGEPGAGKSTLLLDLAEHLLARAEQDETERLPVILPLSSWAVKRGSLEDWMTEQISEIYDVPRKVSTEWVTEERLLPLLDGLDETEETARPGCIAAINAYKRSHITALIVCSRTAEYEAAISHSRLALQGAVVVQPLTHQHVDACLTRAGKPLKALHRALKKNTPLFDLATTPLMLNILMLTYQGISVHDLPNKEATLLQQVWDDYVERMVMRKGNRRRYSLAETQVWLGYLAGQMRDHNQTVFYLEHLQPDWLKEEGHRTYTRLAVRLPAIVIGVLTSILVSLFSPGSIDLPFLFQNGLLGGLLGALWRGPKDLGSREHRHSWGKHLVKRLTVSICIGLISGLSLGFYVGDYYPFNQWLIYALSSSVIMAGGSLLLQYQLAAPFRSRLSPEKMASREWKHVLSFFEAVQGPRAWLVAIVTGLSVGLSEGLTRGLSIGPSIGLSVGLSVGLSEGLHYGMSYGLSYALISLALNAQTDDIHLAERMRWAWRSLFKSRHLRTTVLITCISTLFLGLSEGLSAGLSAGLSEGLNAGLSAGLGIGLGIGLSYWFVLGLIQGMTQERIEDQDRRRPNQGIRRSLRNSVVISLVCGTIIGSIGILIGEGLNTGLNAALNIGLNAALNTALNAALNTGLSVGSQISISSALLICMLTGGLATFRHYTIRYLLSRSHTFPRRAPLFLDDATTRILLRRIGGGYSFVHRLLMDHLADATERSTEQGSASTATHSETPSP